MASPEQEAFHVYSKEYAVSLDAQDPLNQTRSEFLIPSKAQLKAESLPQAGKNYESGEVWALVEAEPP